MFVCIFVLGNDFAIKEIHFQDQHSIFVSFETDPGPVVNSAYQNFYYDELVSFF